MPSIINNSVYLSQPTPLDIKLCNYWINGTTLIIESIDDYVNRIKPKDRAVGVLVSILVPKNGAAYGVFDIDTFTGQLANFDNKYYAFKGGTTRAHFIEVDFGFTYIAYASDLVGTDFSLTSAEELDFMAILPTNAKLIPPVVTDFAGKWFQYKFRTSKSIAGKGTINDKIQLVNDEETPGNIKYYGTNNTGVKGYHVLEIPDSSEFIVNQPNHGFSVGNAIKLNSSTWIPACADARLNAGTVGIVNEIIDADNFKYIVAGLLEGSYAVGENYFLSTSSPGSLMIVTDEHEWVIGEIYEFVGTGVEGGLMIELDLGHELTEIVDPVGTPGADGQPGPPGADAREIELVNEGGYIKWRYVGDTTTSTLFPIPTNGADAREIEMFINNGTIAWGYVGWPEIYDLIAISTLKGDTGDPGANGESIQLREFMGWVEWKYAPDSTWTQLYEVPTTDSTYDVAFQFIDLIPYTYECPCALKFTEQIVKPGNTAATLSVALNTDMTAFSILTITPAQLGLVILKGVAL